MARNKPRKQSGLFLKTPEGMKVKRYNVGDTVRFTTPSLVGHESLIGYAVNGKFVWIRSDCSE